ncbi:hypothetical protein NE848_01840 [Gramella jeungdoensis]|uniref:PH domain-containing protein n=1 Tax=Gramella jeungdoensis TaxID=708091 RepID=A0ABT0YXB3_9FLAO|nr:hypothetical protein [Gramella jeungdoensis]MCM8568098.1 hypothetical protein [Gramella jeungdoensis]
MRVFEEEQAFRQWWLLLILSTTLIGTGIAFFRDLSEFPVTNWKYLSFIPLFFIAGMFWITRLHTRIDKAGISTKFEPYGIFKRSYKWNDISKVYVRKYKPLMEYGGWGIRGFNKAKAYNVSGNMGIQIITKDGERFLIGTKKPSEAEKVIKRYHEKTD